MREIITIQVGGGGNAIGSEFFSVIAGEHGIDNCGELICNSSLEIQGANVFFKECNNRYYARAIAVDTAPDSINTLIHNPIASLYSEGNLIKGSAGSGNNYAKVYSDTGRKQLERVMEAVRLECECADSVQGTQLIHTLGGGTGSGLSSLIFERLDDYLCGKIVQTISIIPSPKLSSAIAEPYNCMLCFPHLLKFTHLTICLDNEALYNIYTNQLKLFTANYHDTNHLIAHAMSGITTSLRFPGQLNTDLRKLFVNMIPFSNSHFLVPGFAPITTPCSDMSIDSFCPAEMVKKIFKSSNILAAIDLQNTKLLTVATIFRGDISPQEVDNSLREIRKKNLEQFVNWIPNNIKTAYCDIPIADLEMSATFIGNATGITGLFCRIENQFGNMYDHKAFLHWFTQYGIEEAEFEEARAIVQDIVHDYKEQARDSKFRESDTSANVVANINEDVDDKKPVLPPVNPKSCGKNNRNYYTGKYDMQRKNK